MSARSRSKGNAAERAVAAWLRDHGWPDCRTTRNAQGGGGTATSDITATDLPWAVEIKDATTPRLAAWWEQTTRQARIEHRAPLLVWHPTGWPRDPGQWLAFVACDGDDLDETVLLVDPATPMTALPAVAAAVLTPEVGQTALHVVLPDGVHLVVYRLASLAGER